MKNNQKGFTLIELLVVIAIIGILATIVLTSLGSARTKATDAKIQAQLSSMRAQAELFYATAGNYGSTGTGCTSSGPTLFGSATATTNSLATLIAGAPSGYVLNCVAYAATGSIASAWAVSATNAASSPTAAWCVDSNGSSKVYTTTSSPTAGGTLIATGACL